MFKAWASPDMCKLDTKSVRFWVIGGVAFVLALILGANAHLLYVAVTSQPGCIQETGGARGSGVFLVPRPATDSCR